ncbi:unnamed protein product, partial [Ectocarpus sp. 12 AP-2014]
MRGGGKHDGGRGAGAAAEDEWDGGSAWGRCPDADDQGCFALWTSTVGARDRGFHARREREGLDRRRLG